jgi:hypothetical protein
MISYPRSARVLELKRASYAIKMSAGETRAEYDKRTADAHAPQERAVTFSQLTLDDFGGRSDALGG